MQILVTGASGFVGQHLVRLLSSTENRVTAWGHGNQDGAGCVEVDLLDDIQPAEQDLTGIEVVVHLAGLASVGPSFSQPQRYIADNAGMQINLFEALIAQKVRPRVLVVSTGGVYGASTTVLTEAGNLNPSNPYVISKMTQEMLARYYQTRDFEVTVVRPFNHIGPGQLEGFMVPDIAKQVVAAEQAGGGEVLVGDLRPKRDYTDVRDIVAAYYAIISRGKAGSLYNVCSGRSVSGQEIVEQLLRLARVPIELRVDPARVRPTEVMTVRASNGLLSQDTGWQPEIALNATLADVIADWRQRLASERP